MEVVLRHILPKILGATSFEVYPHQCKSELLQRLPERLTAYSRWIPGDWRILVLVDRDDDRCQELKERLDAAAETAGLSIRSRPRRGSYTVVNRVVVEELEAWYFGDWEAVRAAFPQVSPTLPQRAGYREPDGINGGTWEAFERALNRSGYFKGGLRKLEAARAIAGHLAPDRNSSRSFQAMRRALVELARR